MKGWLGVIVRVSVGSVLGHITFGWIKRQLSLGWSWAKEMKLFANGNVVGHAVLLRDRTAAETGVRSGWLSLPPTSP